MAIPVLYALLDEVRREAGRALDRAGFGPVESPFRIVTEMPGARLRAYQQTTTAFANSPVLILVPAPIKRAYIWDLLPEVSVVRQCLRRGLRVYLLEWLDPGPAERGLGLADYAERLPRAALDAITAETGETAAFLAGHSLGGTLATVFACRHPDRVRGLVLMDAPLAFGAERGGPLASAVAAVPHIRMLRYFAGEPVPGSFTSFLSIGAAPEVFVLQRWGDFAASFGGPLAAAIHTRVERWALDELAMPGQLFEDVLEQLYREDRFVAGSLQLAGRRTGIDQLRSPMLAVVNPAGRVVAPSSVLAGMAVAPRDVPRRVLRYGGDIGTGLQHLGPLIGPAAHARLWPEILDWLFL